MHRQPSAAIRHTQDKHGPRAPMMATAAQHHHRTREEMERGGYDAYEMRNGGGSGGTGKRAASSRWAQTVSCTVILALTLLCIYLLYLVVFPRYTCDERAAASVQETTTLRPKRAAPSTDPDGHLVVPAGSRLLLVSVFSRHGDRAPTEGLPPGDDLASKVRDFWPSGLGNLTHTGRFRMFRLGLELRRRYSNFLDFDARSFLAFSSRKPRCRDSLELTLRGLFQLDWTVREGLQLVQELKGAPGNSTTADAAAAAAHLPGGSGSPAEAQQVAIDTRTVPSLSMGPTLFPCKYQIEHPAESCEADSASTREALRGLRGFATLERALLARYKNSSTQPHDALHASDVLEICGTVACELQLRRTSVSVAYGRHYYDWVGQRVPEYASSNVSLLELCDQASALFVASCLAGTSQRLQLGPLVTSLITSQEMALLGAGKKQHTSTAAANSTRQDTSTSAAFDSGQLYLSPGGSGPGNGKKIVLYSSHDTVLQPLLYSLGIGRPVGGTDAFERHLDRWRRGGADDTSRFLEGLGMSKFGISFAFELYAAVSATHVDEPFAFVQMALYHEEDAKFKPVDYKRLDFGQTCKQLFREQHPRASVESFYRDAPPSFDAITSCPFELFKNVTSKYLMSATEFNKLCAM